MSRNVTFEVQVLTDKNWVIAEMAGDENQAKAFADNLLQTGNHAAVRVVRDWTRADGLHAETVILEKQSTERKGSDLSLAPVSEAPVCRDLADVFGPAARLTLGRMCRKYLDEVGVTATELLHSHAELKRFGDKDRLLFSAIDRIATLQAAAIGEDAKSRRDFLGKCWDDLCIRARKLSDGKKLAAPKTLADILKARPGEDGDLDYGRRALMSARLLEVRNIPGKLDILLKWAAEEGGRGILPLIDGFVADVVVSAQVIQDLLGFQPNLAHALCSLCDLSEGVAQPAKFAPETFAQLNALFADGSLPQARAVLLGRVARELGGVNPLSRNEPKLEFEMFSKVAHRVVGHETVLGGAALAEALLHRSAQVHNTGSRAVKQALDFLLSALADTVHRVQVLVALAGSDVGRSLGDELARELKSRVLDSDHIDLWVPVRHPPRERMAALAAVARALAASPDLDEGTKAELRTHVDEMLAKYLVDEGVIEKIDKQDDPLALRAIRLVKFCGSGVLIDGKSMALARAAVVEHLRQPQFEEKFLASVADPAKAEKSLREFHKLLLESGFR